jgi:hypothetical protein
VTASRRPCTSAPTSRASWPAATPSIPRAAAWPGNSCFVTGVVDRNLLRAAVAGLAIFAVLFTLGAWTMVSDRPLEWIGRFVQSIRNRVRRRVAPVRDLAGRLRRERDRILHTVGPR